MRGWRGWWAPQPDEVLVADSTSANLFKALVAAARLRPSRDTMVIEPGNFPADLYIAESVSELLGLRLVRVEPGSIGSTGLKLSASCPTIFGVPDDTSRAVSES